MSIITYSVPYYRKVKNLLRDKVLWRNEAFICHVNSSRLQLQVEVGEKEVNLKIESPLNTAVFNFVFFHIMAPVLRGCKCNIYLFAPFFTYFAVSDVSVPRMHF